ncbi:oligosaccharide flippase family protein [Porphyromonas macacae]|uniref:oligosaccharide flippase family protein n=1 Tax=Porphyromonas macacae TaxID=28115 RepID=UPI001F590B04|nr:oligosaccharide flippase family protein [Porphyromonas macacae]
MAGTTASLVKDTAIYGLTTISVKLLSWLMTIVYSRILTTEGMGTMSNLYAWSTLLMIILTYGMETGFSGLSISPGRKRRKFTLRYCARCSLRLSFLSYWASCLCNR